ncbi:hypothetical protein PYCCODRAFT_1372594 [Trametes coccinea BRFM310]|uniref:CxC2-like cysteine cluster KDZ transposase-associated domain-containing protein n=1 Tax=Trametes coccinea (strain BRFM310) TaxID=1353009 RepID=A0A1Y2IHG6_TRAC3|nr:hypothetical protein PYCCODRAFT_1372594 [Trametes coccinea BRFM310]
MNAWLPLADHYLRETVRNEGRGSHTYQQCIGCSEAGVITVPGDPRIRCKDCSPRLYCHACTVKKHAECPFHRVMRWTGRSFEAVSLAELGLTIQLGHADLSPCSNPQPARTDFCVIDINGQHRVRLNFCSCDKAGEAGGPAEQLHRRELYPATDSEPNTAFTYRLLEHYHVQSVQGKVSMFDYYQSLQRLTDNTGTRKLQDRYKTFMRIVAQWRFLKRLKRAGRCHHPSGAAGTANGELAVACPACPRPEVNLPPNWDTVSDELKFLYALTVAIDACFRLKRRAVSSEDKDPILGSGWGCFVEDTGFREILAQYGDQQEMNTCTGLSAVDHANTKFSRGYAATGVCACVCARHEFMLPNGVGDTQKGEKYINSDYVFASAMCHHRRVRKNVSYDIVCQWCKHLQERLAKFPSHLRIEIPKGSLKYVIPKLHYHSHKQLNHSKFSMNYVPGIARTDGEGIERRWWWIQPIASSTKVMGPGQRQGVLEDQWAYANWRKFVNMAWTLRDRLRNARAEHAEHMELFVTLTASLKRSNIKAWTAQILAWEQDHDLDDPYVLVADGASDADVRRVMAEEEQAASARPGYIVKHDVSMLGFITMGLDIEDQQVRLQEDAKSAPVSKLPVLLERRTALRRRIQKLRELQAIYMPSALPLLAQIPETQTDVEYIEGVRLGLPSDISPAHRTHACGEHLMMMEKRLRIAQCRDSLQDVRNKLHTLDHLYKYKKANVRHQAPNTRAIEGLGQQWARCNRAVARYRRARRSRLALDGPGGWESEFRVLHDEDVRGIADDEPDSVLKGKRKSAATGPGEGRKKMSWIWNASDRAGKDAHVESLRIEWLKARARAFRWGEELKLLPEEMRRVLASLKHEEQSWQRLASDRREDVDSALQEGLTAYGLEQASIRLAMRNVFRGVCITEALAATGKLGEEWNLDGQDTSISQEDADTNECGPYEEVQHPVDEGDLQVL